MKGTINQKQQELTWRAIEQVRQLAALFTKRRGQLASISFKQYLDASTAERFHKEVAARQFSVGHFHSDKLATL